MNLNQKLKQYNQAMGLFMVANGILSPIANLDTESLNRMLDSVEASLNSINEEDKAVEQIFFENGKPSLIDGNEAVMFTLYFLANQYKLRGGIDSESENLKNAIESNEKYTNALGQFNKFRNDAKNSFEIIRYTDFFETISQATTSNS